MNRIIINDNNNKMKWSGLLHILQNESNFHTNDF